MRHLRRQLRNFVGRVVGIQPDMQIWWTPELPVIYVAVPKAGCSTIKQSLKTAQGEAYARDGRQFVRNADPHGDDDCLRRKGLAAEACRDRYLFTCVRNPFARALSAYLDKVEPPDRRAFPELRGSGSVSFEDFLRAVAAYAPYQLDDHFRPQHINLNYPSIAYDAIYFLEAPTALAEVVGQVAPGFRLERYAPHARSAAEKLRTNYNATTERLVREIYALDFEVFGYSLRLEDTLAAPGAMIADGRLIAHGSRLPPAAVPHGAHRELLETTLQWRQLIERRLI